MVSFKRDSKRANGRIGKHSIGWCILDGVSSVLVLYYTQHIQYGLKRRWDSNVLLGSMREGISFFGGRREERRDCVAVHVFITIRFIFRDSWNCACSFLPSTSDSNGQQYEVMRLYWAAVRGVCIKRPNRKSFSRSAGVE